MSLFDFLKKQLAEEGVDTLGVLNKDKLDIINSRLYPQDINTAYLWLLPYYTGRHQNRNVSLYAVSRDYHLFGDYLKKKLYPKLKELFPNEEFYFFSDSSPINEISAAVKCGLGVIGKNRLLITGKYGSYVFIGSLLTTLKNTDQSHTLISDEHQQKSCLNCGSCIKKCAFLNGKCDFCYSSLNQTKKLSDEQLGLVRSRKIRWGCDDCQVVCPMNKDVPLTKIPFFYEDIRENVTKEYLESLSDEEFKNRAYSWRGRNVIERNISENSHSN